MDIKQINNIIETYLNEEAARIAQFQIDNEDQMNTYGIVTNKKFAHFHWVYKHKIHFKFANRRPKNKEELIKTIAFNNEKDLLSTSEIKTILRQLKANIDGKTVYDALKAEWENLHTYREQDLQNELIQL